MSCADCHGGDPAAVKQELAHADRTAHPVLNEDVSRCQECHPEECTDRVQIFDYTAGITEVRVAMPYTPRIIADSPPADSIESHDDFNAWMNARELLPILLLAGAGLTIYILHKKRAAEKES